MKLRMGGRVGKNATLNVTRRSSLEEGRPKMAWLMSFPNSGTTYAQNSFRILLEQQQQPTTAHTNRVAISIAVYRDVWSPFFRHPDHPVPETYILTKTRIAEERAWADGQIRLGRNTI
jgi:hypothetical protein